MAELQGSRLALLGICLGSYGRGDGTVLTHTGGQGDRAECPERAPMWMLAMYQVACAWWTWRWATAGCPHGEMLERSLPSHHTLQATED